MIVSVPREREELRKVMTYFTEASLYFLKLLTILRNGREAKGDFAQSWVI